MRIDESGPEKSAAIAALLVATAGILVRPYVSNFLDREAVATLVSESPTRWVAATLLLASGYALATVALKPIVDRGRSVYHGRAGRWSMPAAIISAAAMAYQFGASGIGVYGTVRSGGDLVAYLDEAARWETPTFVVAVLTLGIAWWSTASLASASGLVDGRAAVLVKALAVVAAVGFLIPTSMGEYLSVASLGGMLWLLRSSLRSAGVTATVSSR